MFALKQGMSLSEIANNLESLCNSLIISAVQSSWYRFISGTELRIVTICFMINESNRFIHNKTEVTNAVILQSKTIGSTRIYLNSYEHINIPKTCSFFYSSIENKMKITIAITVAFAFVASSAVASPTVACKMKQSNLDVHLF